MESAGKNKSEVARALGVRWQTVQFWTLGKTAPSADNLRQLAEVLGVDLETLLGVAAGQDPPFTSWTRFLQTPEGAGMTQDERRALQSFAWPTEPTLSQYLMLLGVVRAGPQ
jgi:transcriptional regulator with XRE-family HTH domain